VLQCRKFFNGFLLYEPPHCFWEWKRTQHAEFLLFCLPKIEQFKSLSKPTVRNQSTQWGVMVPSQCLSMLLLMVWYVVSSAHKVKTTFNFVLVGLALMEWLLSKFYFVEIFSAIPWRCNKRFKVLTILNSCCLCKSAKTTTKQKTLMVG